jgi:serine/threonine protein kinase
MVRMSVRRIGRYEIEQTLGRGAMGVVYLARDPLIDRRVALKTLRVDLDTEYAGEFRERFFREAKAAGGLNHPGIVTIHDVGEDPESGLVFIAMEYIEGRDLKRLLADGQRFRPSEAARIAADVARALDYAHSMGVIHRDIKPANIILTQDGTAKITDFGIARLESSNLTVEGQFIGTPNFMSPEQITGNPVDGRSDIFSLGVVVFTLLTGERPFAGETMHEVTMKVVQEPCPIPSTFETDIPPAINPIILKCLEKQPDKRFQSGAEVARVLAALARSLVEREPGDAGQTGVYRPDLETRMHVQPAAGSSSLDDAEPLPRHTMLRDFTSPRKPGQQPVRDAILNRLPLPDALTRDVNPAWVRIIMVGWAALCLGPIPWLALKLDSGPFPSPSDGSVRNQHLTAQRLMAADRLLRIGDLRGTVAACGDVLDQVPASPAARELLRTTREHIEAERTSAETQQRVAALIEQGRADYRKGQYRTASELFEQALELDSENELAANFLDLAKERQRGSSRRSPQPTAQRPSAAPATTSRASEPAARPTPGTARITVSFNSPLNAGVLTVTLNDTVLAEIPFDFTKAGFMGIQRRGTGTVKRVLVAPSGEQRIGIQLRDPRRGLIGSASFQRSLRAGSDWTLRVDLPAAEAEASFYLVETRR